MFQIFNENCLEGMKRLEKDSVDAIICDLPFNMTDCAWDKSVIDLSAMWSEFDRILKPYSATVLFASGKFTHKLIASNLDCYKYKWIWIKNAPTMFVHAKNAPMRKFEEILVFSDGAINHKSCSKRRMKYNPQGVVPCEIVKSNEAKDTPNQLRAGGRGNNWIHRTDKVSDISLQGGKLKGNAEIVYRYHNDRAYHCYGDWAKHGQLKKFGGTIGARPSHVDFYVQEQTGYPTDVLFYNVPPAVTKFHPTQKPTDLLEFLVRTYTDEGETVLDATMGSGSTGVACMNTGRKFIGFEIEEKYFEIAQKRISEALATKQQELF